MFSKNDQKLNKNLDLAAQRIVRASGLSRAEVNRIASSPFLFARVRSRIAVEKDNQPAGDWSGLALVSRRAIPVMGLLAAASLMLFLYVNGNKPASAAFSVDAYLGAGDSGIDNLAIAEKRLTDEEVLKAIISREEREAVR